TVSNGSVTTTQSESKSKATTTELAVVATTTETTTRLQLAPATVNYDNFLSLIPPTKSVQAHYITKTTKEISSAKYDKSGTTSDKYDIHPTSQRSTLESISDASIGGFKWPMTSIQTTYTSKTLAGIQRTNSQQSGNPFPIFMHGVDEGDKTCFISSKQQLSWDMCTFYCKNYVTEFAIIPNNNTWINLVLKLATYGGIYWVAAYRNVSGWRWVNETSLSHQFLRQFTLGNHGDCLSLDLPRNPDSLQPRQCLEKHLCLCQKYLRGSGNNASRMGTQVVTSSLHADPFYVLKTSTSPVKYVQPYFS
ncbi:hypothetical protein ACJMK2_008305, partial [Sinanodonta woodiana]